MTGGPDARVALVTGANRGIGYEICRQLAERGLRVVLTARTSAEGREAAGRLAGDGDVRFERLDVADPASVQALAGAWPSAAFGSTSWSTTRACTRPRRC